MKKLIIALCITMLSVFWHEAKAQGIAVRSNLAADALGIVNLGVDFTLTDQTTVSVAALGGKTYIPVLLKQAQGYGAQLEYRHWFSHQPYENFFLGIQVSPMHYSVVVQDHYDANGNRLKDVDCKHRGFAILGGFNFGYSWPINDKMNIEACYGAGLLGYSLFTDRGPKTNFPNSDNPVIGKLHDGWNYAFSTTNFGINVTYILK